MSTTLRYVTAEIPVCVGARSAPVPPTGDGADVSSWTRAAGDKDAVELVEVSILAGAAVELSDVLVLAKELRDTFPEESHAVTPANATEKFAYTGHGFLTGDGPVRFAGDALPDTIDGSAEYWIIKTGANDFKVATSRANALAGTAVAFATDGSNVSVYWVTSVKSRTQAASAIDATANTFTIVGHGLSDDEIVQIDNVGGAVPTSLAADTDYYAIVVDADTISFAATEGGDAIDFSGGSGTQYVTRDLRATSAAVYSPVFAPNAGDPFDLAASVGFRDRFDHRPDVLSYHLGYTSDSPVPITCYVRGLTTCYDS